MSKNISHTPQGKGTTFYRRMTTNEIETVFQFLLNQGAMARQKNLG